MTGTGKRNWPPRVHHLVQVKRRVRHQRPRNPPPVQKAHDVVQDDQDIQDIQDMLDTQNDNGLLGGCAGTRYGCCPDGVTARNETGSNCPGTEPTNDTICTEETDVVFVGPNRTPVIGQCINENGTLVCRFQNACP